MQRYHRVHEIDVQPVGVSEADFIPSAENMGVRECMAERSRLMIEKTRTEQEMQVATGHQRMALGRRYQALCSRLGIIGKRIKLLNRQRHSEARWEATKEIVGPEICERIIARQQELIAERERADILSEG